RKKKGSKPTTFAGFVERCCAEAEDYVKSFEDDFGSGATLVESFKALPDEKKNAALVKKLTKAREALEKAAKAKTFLAHECDRLQQLEASIQQRRGGKPKMVVPDLVEAN